ncbi:MAG TPA: prolipoprotein diacylglyceryl transferase [Anaerolineaceae bacterium]
MSIDRYGIHIGVLFIHFYGLILMAGVLAATFVAQYRAKKAGDNGDTAWDMLTWALIGGIIGARLWHILTPPPSMGITFVYYLTHPLDAIAIWKGGLGIVGAVAGGALGVYLYCRKYKVSFLKWADYIAPGLALAQAIGRWGNFVNQELYGLPTNLPWKLYIDPEYRKAGFENVEYFHPLFLYESIWNLLVMGLLLWLGKRFRSWLKAGDLLLVYLMAYPLGRFLLEFIRIDASEVAGLNINQALMLVVIIAAGIGLYLRHRLDRRETPSVPDQSSDSSEAADSA